MRTWAIGCAVVIGASFALSTTASWSQQPAALAGTAAIEKRQELMKSAGRAAKAAGQMVKGEIAWDAAAAEAAMQTLVDVGTQFPTLFPDDSRTGSETEAAPAIWEDKADFEAHAASLATDAEAAKMAAADGLDAFKPAFGKAASNCRSCHETFRTD